MTAKEQRSERLSFDQLYRDYAKLKAERDELLAALKLFMPNGKILVNEGYMAESDWKAAQAAIKAAVCAKGEAA
jgi:hypothetical protein